MTTIERYTPNLSREGLEESRAAFAAQIVMTAIRCRFNSDFLAELGQSFPPDFFTLISEGSTRRVYATPLGVVLKVQREDVFNDGLSDYEMNLRGGSDGLFYLHHRRRIANLAEMLFSIRHPLLMPKQYGYVAALGFLPKNVSVVITEAARPLTADLPEEWKGIRAEDMGVDEDGYLRIFDPRVVSSSASRPNNLQPFDALSITDGETLWLGNIGTLSDGHHVLLDCGNYGGVRVVLNEHTMCPDEWGWTFAPTAGQILHFSSFVTSKYFAALRESKKRGETLMPGNRPPA